MKREQLSPEERDEYDALMVDAGIDEFGSIVPSDEIGPRMHVLLEDALQAGRTWAGWVLADDAEEGHRRRFNAWNKARNKTRMLTPAGIIVPRAAVVGVRRKREDGSVSYQQSFWGELSWAEVEQKLEEANAQLGSARINASTARRLLDLRERAPESASPAEACVFLGIELDAYLAGEAWGAGS